MANFPEQVLAEGERAEDLLIGLAGEEIKTISIHSDGPDEAPFLGKIVSKLSPMIGNLIEMKIVDLLHDELSEHGMTWRRQDPGFPDAVLVNSSGEKTGVGYEVKAWYALSTELTGRFRESVRLLQDGGTRVAIVAWMLSDLVYGTPVILDVLTVDALSVARQRDLHYHSPPTYLCVEPEDTSGRTSNLQQSNVGGYRLQDVSPSQIQIADRIISGNRGASGEAHTTDAQALANELRNHLRYRLDTNFGKVDRIDHPDIEAFKKRVLGIEYLGKKLPFWVRTLRDLENDARPENQTKAIEAVQTVY
jgi:hypothetical protein